MTNQKGSISIHTENIFPIIKKWLYSDKDIFIRELISNGCDAVNKYKKLISLGEAKGNTDENYKIKVSIDKENSALIFEDNGIGMTSEEVEKYINQVAFSGAEDFFNTYKDKINEENDIIGHFGLGFYSSFMVSKTSLWYSYVPCEKLSLATFIPASAIAEIVSLDSVDGPKVQMIFVFLIFFISL